MRRREFIALFGGTAAAWPLAARAQQASPLRRIGVLMLYPENDREGQLRATAFRQGLQKLGWEVGRNIQIDYLWGLGDADWIRSAAAQLLRLAPDVILANGTPAARIMQQSSRTVPVIFIAGSDPVLDGLAQSLAHPGGNLTGLYVFEPSLGAKLLALLKEIAPRTSHVAIVFNPDASVASWLTAAATEAPRIGIDVFEAPLRDADELAAAMAGWGREPNFGLIVLPDPAANAHRKFINELAVSHQLPVVHAQRAAAVEGGLASYGADLPDVFRQAATYADHITRNTRSRAAQHTAPPSVIAIVATIAAITSCVISTPSLCNRLTTSKMMSWLPLFSIFRRISSGSSMAPPQAAMLPMVTRWTSQTTFG
jgi:putative ABC transport system substrate-binding protein